MNGNHFDPTERELEEAQLTAYALGQLGPQQRAAVEEKLARSEKARQLVRETTSLAEHVYAANRQVPPGGPSAAIREAAIREAIEKNLDQLEGSAMTGTRETRPATGRGRRIWGLAALAVCLLILAVPLSLPWIGSGREAARREQKKSAPAEIRKDARGDALEAENHLLAKRQEKATAEKRDAAAGVSGDLEPDPLSEATTLASIVSKRVPPGGQKEVTVREYALPRSDASPGPPGGTPTRENCIVSLTDGAVTQSSPGRPEGVAPQGDPASLTVSGGGVTTLHGSDASYAPTGPVEMRMREVSRPTDGRPHPRSPGKKPAMPESELVRRLGQGQSGQQAGGQPQPVIPPSGPTAGGWLAKGLEDRARYGRWESPGDGRPMMQLWTFDNPEAPGTEQYDAIVENPFIEAVGEAAVSTFSVDVDTASYANVRRFLSRGQPVPPAAVRIEEMVNYFRYDYPPPEDDVPFSAHMEVAQCPWNGDHRLLRIGLKGREIDTGQRGPSHLVFLLDVSGSMRDDEKLPLVKQAMTMLTDQLGEDDRVAIVTYAGQAGLRLESTGGHERDRILTAVESLSAGGSTHGSAGIQLAYQQAVEHFVEGGANRVILCTDGDLNVGITDDDELVKLITQQAKSGVFLTVLGFGTGNLKDSKMEKLADKGNGIYAYIDSLREAKKVLVEQLSGSLVTIAKDVKVQVIFNPAEVQSYRLIGYENRMLAARDFKDDKKDAGEIGAGHTVTALYELVPAGNLGTGDEKGPDLKYQRVPKYHLTKAARSGELLTLKLRWKQPDATKSTEREFTLTDDGKRFGQASTDFRFASAVAAFGMVLRGSQYRGGLTLSAVEEFAAGAAGDDPGGYRKEFADLVRRAREISSR